jgi:hypothetical protein
LLENEDMTKDKIEDTGGELTAIPNEKYEKFFAKFAEVETLEVSQWKVAHLLGYFCKKYKDTYGVAYPWKFNNPNPNKCFEVWQMNTLVAKLSANPQILKDYIDWAYQKLVPQAKRRLTSISFMTKDEVVNPYKMNVLLGGKKSLNTDRSTPLPQEYKDIISFGLGGKNVGTYGDLAFLHHMYSSDPNSEAGKIWMGIIDTLKQVGFDTEIIGRIV